MENVKYLYVQERKYGNLQKENKELRLYWEKILGADAIHYIENVYNMKFSQILFSDVVEKQSSNDLIKKLNEFENSLCNGESSKLKNGMKLKKRLVFSNFFMHFVEYAVTQREINFSPILEESYIETLLTRLCKICVSTLMFEMYIENENNALKGETPKEQYDYYNNEMLTDNNYIKQFFHLYPCLERLIYESISDITFNYIELNERLERDHKKIVEELCFGKDFSKIVAIRTGISDSHKKGKAVAILTFDNGYKVVYKPHSLKLEKAYQYFLENMPIPYKYKLKGYKIIERNEYGWTEFIENKECKSKNEVERYYYRFGMLIFLNYLLSTNDLHFENVIACGEYPIIIDAETALNTHKEIKTLSANDKINLILQKSVLASGLLPYYRFGKAGKGINMGAINGKAGAEYPILVPRIKDNFTSHMHFEYVHPQTEISKNLVILNGKEVDPSDFMQEVVDGFSDMYKNALDKKKEIINLLKVFENLNVRYLVQDTQRYTMVLHTSFHPDFLQDARDRELFLSNIYSTCNRVQCDVRIAKAEVSDMLSMDIPYFFTKANSKNLYTSTGEVIENYFERSGFEFARQKISGLHESDMEKQCMYIQIALARLNDVEKKVIKIFEHTKVDVDDKRIYIRAVESIADAWLKDAVFNDHKDDVNWIGVFVNGNDEEARWEVRPLTTYLYEGISGIAIFFNALDRFYKGKYKMICDAIKTELFKYTDDMLEKGNGYDQESSGIFCGESSLLYVYQLLFKITGQREYLVYAEKHYKILQGAWVADKYYDVIYGNAGALLAVLNMYMLFNEDKYLFDARKIGDFLLQHQCKNGGWRGETSANILAGFSHGIAGIAFALTKLWKFTGNNKYLSAALNGIKYEDTLYDYEAQNWKDERVFSGYKSSDKGNFMIAWCHGAAGVLLSRIKCYELLEKKQKELLKDDIHNALDTVCKAGRFDNNCLCHGNLGNAEILLEYHKIMPNNDVENIYKNMFFDAAISIRNGQFDCGRAYLYGHKIPGFMTGMAGMGYELLKFIMPELPCVLSGEI